jgi:DNA-binding protein YbaB
MSLLRAMTPPQPSGAVAVGSYSYGTMARAAMVWERQMDLPNPLRLLRIAKRVLDQKDELMRQANVKLVGSDGARRVQATFDQRTSRLTGIEVDPTLPPEQLAEAVRQAVNDALEKSDRHWVELSRKIQRD